MRRDERSEHDDGSRNPLGSSGAPGSSAASRGTRILSRRDVRALLDVSCCIEAVEEALRAHAAGRTVPPGILGAPVDGGGFHLKAAGILGESPLYAAKLNGNFPANFERFGMPRIQGLVVLCDARNGFPLAVMDSNEITALRTAAATAVAARYLAREDSEVVTICGCGQQGAIHLRALHHVLPLRRAYLYDRDLEAAERLAAEARGRLSVAVVASSELGASVRSSDVCVTCTPSSEPFLGPADVAPGSFVAAVGSDSEEKQELEPELLSRSRVVVDHLEQCAAIGELHHALDRGLMSRFDVHAELHEVVSGSRPARSSADETFVFDSTGVALEDVGAAALVFRRAVAADAGLLVELLS